MKKWILFLVMSFAATFSAAAMSYEQVRQQALFLTDKMAYELNLTDEQYEAAYEINFDYLMNVRYREDLYGPYWTQRNMDLSYVLMDWQYRSYCETEYFMRPLYWDAGYWRFRVYARYPRRDYYYFGRPSFYDVYNGGHSWRLNGGRSWYSGRSFGRCDRRGYYGMRDSFNQGRYGRGIDEQQYMDGVPNWRTYGGVFNRRPSSTRMLSPREGHRLETYRGGTFGTNSGSIPMRGGVFGWRR